MCGFLSAKKLLLLPEKRIPCPWVWNHMVLQLVSSSPSAKRFSEPLSWGISLVVVCDLEKQYSYWNSLDAVFAGCQAFERVFLVNLVGWSCFEDQTLSLPFGLTWQPQASCGSFPRGYLESWIHWYPSVGSGVEHQYFGGDLLVDYHLW